MPFKILADTFSVARDSDHFIQLKTLKKPRVEDEVWLIFEIIGNTKFARSTVQSIIETIEEVFFKNLELDGYERFENTLKEINLIYRNLKEKRGVKSVGTINAIIAAYSGNDLLLTQTKDAEAYLIRKGKLSPISEGLSGKSDDLFANIASGELMSEDKVIFTTSRLLRLVTHAQLAQICSEGVTESLDSIRELVLADNELSIGVAIMHIKLPQRATVMSSGKVNPLLDKFKKYLLQWWDKGASFIEEKTGAKKVKNLSRNTILAAILLVVLLLIISVSFLMDGRRDNALRDEYKLRIEAMNQDLHVANTKGYANDKETANAILEKVEQEARDILETNYFRSEALALLDKIQETRDSINNTTRLSEITPYVDLSQKRENVEALGLVNLDDNFFAYEYNALYEVILDQVLDPKTIDETEVVMAGTAMEDYGVLVFLTQSGRIIEYDEGQFNFINTNDDNWKPGIDVTAYGKYLYLLSPSTNQIYKYSRLRSEYSSATEYNTDAEIQNAISFAIDGNIYVLKKGGEIIQLFKAKKQTFEIEDLAVDLSDATKLFTSPELDNLYVLDPVNRRVVVIEKEVGAGGRYKEQIFLEDLDDIQSFYVNKSEDKLYLLTKKQIYQVEM
ncbi:hypothetical protein KKA95_02495 [Patescibacteria group bacterium]|nr:hypothetical protein [Patescibacteria group bacterium]